jgi:heme A synthase
MASSDRDLSALWLSPFVIASRLPILFAESLNPTPSRRRETNRMVVEKLAAIQEGVVAAQLALGAAVAENMAALAFGQTARSTPRKTADAMLRAGLAPAARRVRANAKRLGQR